MGDLQEPNGGSSSSAGEERPLPSPSTSILSNPSSSSIGPEHWLRAEEATQKIICKVQPTAVSEERRKEVIDFVQRLIRNCLGCEVFPYGSVPLKTYLPDGDIDLTVFGGASVEDILADDMVSVLEGEDQNRAAEFVVKDIQLIRAEVKLVKCIVQNIVVDISFNQIGGLCTLCFLEQVDSLIGKGHLFKRSIILIKAWCYYESRILGAHHGLISTYALETLVLYIFHLFHSTLNGPLAVLYKFLDYFSKFDWENYCISLAGPVRLSSLPELVVDAPENGGDDLLLSSDFLRHCTDMFSVPSRGADLNSRIFQTKHLNIVDPLKENNNLGRSVSKGMEPILTYLNLTEKHRHSGSAFYDKLMPSYFVKKWMHKCGDEILWEYLIITWFFDHKSQFDVNYLFYIGNFYRIRSAFTYGARKLGRILLQPEDDVADGLCKFFFNTLDRHGSGQRPDVQGSFPIYRCNGYGKGSSLKSTDSYAVERVILKPKSDTNGSFHGAVNDLKASGLEATCSRESEELDHPATGNSLNHPIFGDAKDLAPHRVEGLKISNDLSNYPEVIGLKSVSPVGTPYYAPHHYYSKSMLSNGERASGNSDRIQLQNSKKKVYPGVSHRSDGSINGGVAEEYTTVGGDEDPVAVGLTDVNLDLKSVSNPENLHHITWDWTSESAKSSEPFSILSDLNGDNESHFKCLQYGRWCYEYALNMTTLPMPPPPPSVFRRTNSWDAVQHSLQFNQNGFSHKSVNGVVPNPSFYTVNPLLIPGMAFGLEDVRKPRGTGTYFPNMSRPPQGYRPSAVKGRNQSLPRSPHNSGRNPIFVDTNLADQSGIDFSQPPVSIDQNGDKLGHSNSFSPRGKGYSNVNGLVLQSEGGFEFGSVGRIPVEAQLQERGRHQQQRYLSPPENPSPVSPTRGMQKLKPVLSRDHDRVSVEPSYNLKNEDFPPL